MLSIGEFAGMTGLSVKALRHYDEKEVLVPSDVDGHSGYRRYAEDQVRSGVIVRALRDAGVPLPSVAAAIATGEADTAMAVYREKTLEDRVLEDRAFEQASQVLSALAVPVDVLERTMDAQPYVGRVLSVTADEADSLSDEDANEHFAQLFAAVQGAGAGPSGPFWTTLRAGDHGRVEVVCCWPTTVQLDAEWGGTGTAVGALPHRTELVAIWSPGEGQTLPEGVAHPAVVALFDAIAERGIKPEGTEVRQRVVGSSEHDYVVEVAVTAA